MEPGHGRRRAVIESITPQVDGGRFAVKRIAGETLTVEADVFCDGHDRPACALQYRRADSDQWHEVPMAFLVNDRWHGGFQVAAIGNYRYRVIAWVDHLSTWREELKRRVQAADIAVALQTGARLIAAAAARADPPDRAHLEAWAASLIDGAPLEERRLKAFDEELHTLAGRHPDRRFATLSEPELPLVVERERARFSAWYELFPRSTHTTRTPHGSLREAAAALPYVAEMGFDVIYLPPIHPIGLTHRKGRNNVLVAGPDDPGSPWAIGAPEGGHTSVHPTLGTLDDFRFFLAEARARGIEVALDIAFQCSPDHPWVREHDAWFLRRPDGTIQYAENPPKKYEDIFPFHFESEEWAALWSALKTVVTFWADQGVRIFRVDNPHTKPFPLWEWLIAEVKRDQPDILFLAEAFSRPKVMYRLAKLGFTQSYTYFTWRNTKWELTRYLTELTRTHTAEFFIPNLWPNTPDILPEYLQYGGRPAFMARLVLAATLSASYGVYGPPFELLERHPAAPGSEEYLDSEKYQVRHWDLARPDTLRDFVARINGIRRSNPALQRNESLRFHLIDNDQLIAYSKHDETSGNAIVTVVNLDPVHVQSGWLELPLPELGVAQRRPYQVHDLITDERHLWHGQRNYVQLDPDRSPAHIFRLRHRVRREQDFEYFM
jgi:starch synthase (maltosyl-transferring)